MLNIVPLTLPLGTSQMFSYIGMDENTTWDDQEGDDLIAMVDTDMEECQQESAKPPLFKYRSGRVHVSDLSSQMYCEQKLLYTLIGVPRLRELGHDIEEGESPQVSRGTDIHLAKELEVHDLVRIHTETREDHFALQFLNFLCAVQALLSGVTVVREVPVFGIAFGGDVFINGIIDEIRCDSETLQIDLIELKTRATSKPPSKSVQESYQLQLMVYCHLLRNLILGHIQKADVEKGFRVNMNVKFSKGVLEHMSPSLRNMDSLNLLVPFVLETAQALPLPTNLMIEYFSQEKNCSLGYESVYYDEGWLIATFGRLLPFWKGERAAEGVKDVEEAWKCRCCPFYNLCEWRLSRDRECVEQNSKSFQKIPGLP